jgi:hypothetical protein
VLVAVFALIAGFGCASYAVGLREMLAGRYAPQVFSRIVWLLLAALSFAGVVASDSAAPTVLLSAIFLAGNAAICIASFWKGASGIGRLEYLCLGILGVSAVVWPVFDAPVAGVAISLLAHFVGGAPTYRAVWRDPSSESAGFWSLFFIASALSLAAGLDQPVRLMIFPIYFAVFDGGMTLLALRRAGLQRGGSPS